MNSKKEKKRKCDADDNDSDQIRAKEKGDTIHKESNVGSFKFLTSETK